MVVCLRPTGVKLDENWADAKKMLADTSLLDKLKRYPKDSITEKMMKSVRKYFKNPKMTVENMKSVSKAGALSCVATVPSLCCWDSCLSHDAGGGLIFEFEAIRTAHDR